MVRLAGLAMFVVGALLLAGAVSTGRLTAGPFAAPGGLSPSGVRDWIEPAGALAPVAYVVLSAGLGLLLFPGPLLAAAAGLLFGTALGFLVSTLAGLLGACLAFLIGRAVAGEAVVTLAGPRVLAARELVSRHGFLAVLYARLIPGVPDGPMNYAAGLTAISLPVYAAATVLGTAPRGFAYVALGGSLGDLRSPEAIAAIAILVLMALGGLVQLLRERRRVGRPRPPGSAAGSSSPAGPTAGPP